MHIADLPTSALITLSSLLGISSHLTYFIHGEHHLNAVPLAIILLTTPPLLFTIIYLTFPTPPILLASAPTTPLTQSTILTTLLTTPYLFSLTLSILTYRIFFSPLHHFPGPLSSKISKLTHVYRLWGRLDNYLQADALHKKYGDIVRVGPNEVNILIPAAVPVIYGANSKCRKTAWYDVIGRPNKSLQLERDPVVHAKRRRVWDQAFSSKALQAYTSRILHHSDQLISQLKARSGETQDCSLWMSFFAFDVMGDIAFGKDFDMLASGKAHKGLSALKSGMRPLGLVTPIPWACPIFQSLPQPRGIDEWIEFCDAQIEARKKDGSEKIDIMTHLIEAEREHEDPVVSDPRWLPGDTRLVIVAGSDTTSSALTHAIYHLGLSPHLQSTLYSELISLPCYSPATTTSASSSSHQDKNEAQDLQNAKYLNGIINETLRLHPPVPSGVLRQTPAEGIVIPCSSREGDGGRSGGNDIYIPGNTIVSCPSWSMGRLESCYPRAHEFLPERWGDQSDLVLNKEGFIPFASGPYTCIGKQLALLELRIVIARLVLNFKISFPIPAAKSHEKDSKEDENGRNGHGNRNGEIEGSQDVFTMEMGQLPIVFTQR